MSKGIIPMESKPIPSKLIKLGIGAPDPPLTSNHFNCLNSIRIRIVNVLVHRANRLKLLHHFLYLSSLFGFLPLRNVLRRNVPLTLHRCSLIYIYSALLVLISLAMGVDIISNGLPVYIDTYYSETLDMLIGGCVESGSNLLTERFIRIFAFYYIKSTAGLLQFVRDSRTKLESMKSMGTYLPSDPYELHDYNFIKMHFLLLLSFALAALNYAYKIKAIFSGTTNSYVNAVHFSLIPEVDWMIRGYWMLNDWMTFTSLIFIIGIVFLVGSELTRLYTEFKDCLIYLYMEGCPEATKASKPKIAGGVETLFNAFDEFGRIGGTYAFITTAVSTISLCQNIYMAVISGNVLSYTGFLASFCYIVTLIGIGNVMQYQIYKGKRQLQNILHLHEGKNEHLRPIVYRASVWKWKLTARSAFNVDNGLIAGVLTTVMTYVIFQFQIRFSKASLDR